MLTHTFHSENPDVIIARPVGEVRADKESDDFIHEAAERCQKQRTNLIIDLSQVKMIDSVGLGFFLVLKSKISQAGSTLVIVNPNEVVTKMFNVSRLGLVIPIYGSIEAALNAIAESKSDDQPISAA